MPKNGSRVIWWRKTPAGSTLVLKLSGGCGLATALVVDSSGKATVDDAKLRKGHRLPLAGSDTTDVHIWFELGGTKPPLTMTLDETVVDSAGNVIRSNTYETTLSKGTPDDVAIVTVSVL